MSSWSEAAAGPRVLRGADARRAAGAAIDVDLTARRLAGGVDPELLARVTEESRAAARAEGLAAGLAEGRALAAAEARAEAAGRDVAVRGALAALAAAAHALEQRRVAGAEDVEDQVAALAFDVAAALLGRELELATDPGRDAVARALRLAPPRLPVTVRLSPADAAALGDVADLAAGRALTVVADAALAPGDAVAEAGAATVDARLGPALARVREVLAPVSEPMRPDPEAAAR